MLEKGTFINIVVVIDFGCLIIALLLALGKMKQEKGEQKPERDLRKKQKRK